MSAGFNDTAMPPQHFSHWDELLEDSWEYVRLQARAESWALKEEDKACFTCPFPGDCKDGARACPLNASGFLAAERRKEQNTAAKARQRDRLGKDEVNRRQREQNARPGRREKINRAHRERNARIRNQGRKSA